MPDRAEMYLPVPASEHGHAPFYADCSTYVHEGVLVNLTCAASNFSVVDNPCLLAQCVCGEVGAASFGSYVVHWQCGFGGETGWAIVPYLLLLLIFMLALCSTAGNYLEPQLGYISNLLRLKPDVAGVTLLAFGNSSPDCFTGLAVALAHPQELDYSLMLSYTSGATLFIMTVVVGCIILIASHRAPDWKLSRLPFYRDVIYVCVAMTSLLVISSNAKVYLPESLSFVVLYIGYVTLVITLRYYVQPHWPDDSFGVFLSQKAGPALKHIEKGAERAKVAIGSERIEAAASAGRRLKRSLTGSRASFAETASRGLVGEEIAAVDVVVAPVAVAPVAGSCAPLQLSSEPLPTTTTSTTADDPAPPIPLPVAPAADDDDDGLEDLDWPADGGVLAKANYILELPLSILRRASIPSDACWDERRRRWVVPTPVGAMLVLLLTYCGDFSTLFSSYLVQFFIFPLVVSPLCFAIYKFTDADKTPKFFSAYVACGFMMTIAWMNLVANEVVALIETLGTMLGVSTSLLGLTLIAWGNSAGDMIANTTVAKGGEDGDAKKGSKMALAACFGSPLLMNLIGTGGALSAHMLVNRGAPVNAFISQNCRIAYLWLAVAIISHLVVFPASGYAPPKVYAYYLFTLYAIFLVFEVMAAAGALGDFLGGTGPPPSR